MFKDTLTKTGAGGFEEVFHKGREENDFNGMVFVKYSSVARRDAASRAFNGLKTGFGNDKSFMSPDLPMETPRVVYTPIAVHVELLRWSFLDLRRFRHLLGAFLLPPFLG